MEPRIQYARTSDGVSIAYAVLGEGPPIVFASAVFGGLYLYESRSATTRLMPFFPCPR